MLGFYHTYSFGPLLSFVAGILLDTRGFPAYSASVEPPWSCISLGRNHSRTSHHTRSGDGWGHNRMKTLMSILSTQTFSLHVLSCNAEKIITIKHFSKSHGTQIICTNMLTSGKNKVKAAILLEVLRGQNFHIWECSLLSLYLYK